MQRALSARAESRSVPNGFSRITRVRSASASPASWIVRTTAAAAEGGTARWKSRRGEPPSACSAAANAFA